MSSTSPIGSGGKGYNHMNDELLFNAVLRPNRSLAKNGFIVVMGLMSILCVFGGGMFMLAGAWPVTGFLGLELVLLYVCFQLMRRSGFLTETVQLRRSSLTVSRCSPDGRQTAWHFQPYWLKVEFDPEAGHTSRVILTSKGNHVSLGSFLSPSERAQFATALTTALRRCASITPLPN